MDYMNLNFDLDGDGVADSYGEELDLNGDGIVDAIGIDTNLDGEMDVAGYDMDGDGIYDEVHVDTDYDGNIDEIHHDANHDGIDEVYVLDDGAANTDNTDSTDSTDNTDNTDNTDGYESELVDIDGDGYAESELIDTNGDGFEDVAIIDTDGDGYADTVIEDTDFDGNFDRNTYNADSDGDGVKDTIIEEQYFDNDGDGIFDMMNVSELDEATGEMVYQKTEILHSDDNENPDNETVEPNKDDLVEIEPIFVDDADNGRHYYELDNFDPNSANMDNVVGDPDDAMEVWEYQGDTKRCALYSQKFIIEEYTGQEIDMEEFADIAEANGWFTEEGGTPVIYIDKMLQYYGLDTEMTSGNDLSDIAEALNNGDKVIISVDADEYWGGENDDMYTPNDGINHAVEVIGIDYSDPENPMVILNDSGSPDGCGEMIPYSTFMDAWSDGDCRMVVCSND